VFVRVTGQFHGDTHISGGQNSKTPKLIDENFGVGVYVDDHSLHAKTQNDRPIGAFWRMREISSLRGF